MDAETSFRIETRLRKIEAAICAPPRKAHTLPETCEALGISEGTLRALMAADRIRSTRTGPDGKSGAHLFPIAEIERFLAVRGEVAP